MHSKRHIAVYVLYSPPLCRCRLYHFMRSHIQSARATSSTMQRLELRTSVSFCCTAFVMCGHVRSDTCKQAGSAHGCYLHPSSNIDKRVCVAFALCEGNKTCALCCSEQRWDSECQLVCASRLVAVSAAGRGRGTWMTHNLKAFFQLWVGA